MGRGGMNVDVGAGAIVAASSVPPEVGGGGGAQQRASSVRRRLMMQDDQVSPKATRPAAFVQPGMTPLVPEMNNRALTNDVVQQKAAIEALHGWVKSIADAATSHTAMLDAQDVDIGHMKGKLARYEQSMTKGLLGAEEQLAGTFVKMDAIVATLRADTTTTSADLAAKVVQLEQGMAALQNMVPPGLPQQQQQGENQAGARDPAVFHAVVTELSQTLGATRQEVAQHADKLASLKVTSTQLEGGISETAGRVLALEEYCKSRPMGEASSTQKGPADAFDPWAASAKAQGARAGKLGSTQGGKPET